MSLFGGVWTVLLTLTFVVGAVAFLAIPLDHAAGPGALGREGSAERGVLLGVVSSLSVAVLAWVVVVPDIGAGLPDLVRIAPAALPFAALAGLRWPGVVRMVTALGLIATGAVVAVPRWVDDARGPDGTDRHRGRHDRAPRGHHGGGVPGERAGGDRLRADLDRLPTRGRERRAGPAVVPRRRDDDRPRRRPRVRPTSWWTPAGDHPTNSCDRIADDRWHRTSDSWQQVLERRDDVWFGVAALLDVPAPLLDEAMTNARPMTDEE